MLLKEAPVRSNRIKSFTTQPTLKKLPKLLQQQDKYEISDSFCTFQVWFELISSPLIDLPSKKCSFKINTSNDLLKSNGGNSL
jgi:HKD family nuclease